MELACLLNSMTKSLLACFTVNASNVALSHIQKNI